MNTNYLEWINTSCRLLVENVGISKFELKTADGEITVYRVVNIIRVDVKLEETHK